MTASVVGLVLFAALLHSTWNAILKSRDDRLGTIAIMSAASAVIALFMLPFLPMPTPKAWPWLVASAAAHIGYRVFLTKAYDHGDLSKVYPLARGAAPLITAGIAAFVAQEILSGSQTLGVIMLAGGIMLLTLDGGLPLLIKEPRAVVLSLATAAFITSYTVFDGMGARANTHALSYMAWLALLDGLPIFAFIALRQGKDTMLVLAQNWRAGSLCAAVSFAAYAIVIWAMTQAPIALVAALRETSVVLAAIIGAVLFKETFGALRWLAVLCVALGMAAMRL